MNFINQPTSAQIKLFNSLKNKKKRDENRLFIAEGEKLCNEAFNSSYKVNSLLLKKESSSNSKEIAKKYERKKIPVYFLNEKTFNRICDTVTPQDIIAVLNYREDKPINDESFVALDQISDPGNIGTIIRTAEWFGFNQVLLSESCADKYNPKLVRATMGSLFRMNIISGLNFSQSLRNIFPEHIFLGASLNAKKSIEQFKPNKKFGLFFGNEAHGLSAKTKYLLDEEFRIKGDKAESLNVAVAAGIALYYFKEID
ncbi:MAG: RNA methyltransferase [Bacteroidetes bacterium]|nr:MAG: RNA methyltransferase [Bacteroidota bacterium]